MNRMVLMLLFGAAVLVGFSNFHVKEEFAPAYVAAMALVIPLLLYFHGTMKAKNVREERAQALMKEAQLMYIARTETRSKIPKNSPRRDSALATEGAKRLSAVRSMAALVRKPRLRERVLEVCEFGDLVLETIRRMPDDTPAAVTFVENHLLRFFEALERCFERYRKGNKGVSATESDELESFSLFIALFRKQQDSILFESFGSGKGRGITA